MGQNPAIEMLNLKSGFHSIYQVQQIRNKGEIVSFLDQRFDTFRIPVALNISSRGKWGERYDEGIGKVSGGAWGLIDHGQYFALILFKLHGIW